MWFSRTGRISRRDQQRLLLLKSRRAFTLIEALVAMFVMAVVVVGAMQALSLAERAGSQAERMDLVTSLAREQLERAVLVTSDNLLPQSGESGAIRWDLTYSTKSAGLVLATVRVAYSDRGIHKTFILAQLFKPVSDLEEN